MVDQTISYNDKSITRRGRGKEAHNSQRLFFIKKELQLNTKFHYIEVAATAENYRITLCISKTTVKRKSFFTSAYTSSRQKTQKKNLEKGKGKEKKRECEREGKEKGKGEGKGEGRGERERREEKRGKKGESGTKSFLSTLPPPVTFASTVPSSDVAKEQHNSHKGGTREKHNSYKQKTIETKRQLSISRQTSCNVDQTLTLHHARIPITPKKGRRFEA